MTTRLTSRVLVVGMHFAPETTGNAPYTTALARSFSEGGADVTVVTGIPHYPEWRPHPRYKFGVAWMEQRQGVRIRRVRHAVPKTPNLWGRLRMELSFFALTLPTVLFSRSDYIVAISPTLSGVAATLLGSRGRPFGVIVQDLNSRGARETGLASESTSGLLARVEYSMMRRASVVGTIAPRFAEILTAEGKLDPSRLVSVPNFTHVKPVRVSRDQSRVLLGWPTDRFLAVHTGNMGRKQGLDVLIDMAAGQAGEADPPVVVLVGDGNQREELERRAAGLKSVLFVPPLTEELYPHALNAADVLLVTEKVGVREMSLPSKITSYTVARKPVVAAAEKDGMTGRLLAHAGLVVDPGDADSLSRAIDAVRSDPLLRDRLTVGCELLGQQIGGQVQAYERYRSLASRLERLASKPGEDRAANSR